MTRLVEEALQQLCELLEAEQDLAADVLLAYLSSDEREYHQPRLRRGTSSRRVNR